MSARQRFVRDVGDVLAQAGDLLTDHDDTNPEYDRALVELTCRLIGLSTDDWRDPVARAILGAASGCDPVNMAQSLVDQAFGS